MVYQRSLKPTQACALTRPTPQEKTPPMAGLVREIPLIGYNREVFSASFAYAQLLVSGGDVVDELGVVVK